MTCAEDDFPAWQNYRKFYDQAEFSKAGCVVGRELTVTTHERYLTFHESQEYRKWCIHNTNNPLLDFQRAHNPIVCTFYQFFKTDTLNQIHAHWASLSNFYPGNKMQEIIFRSSTFVLSKVVFEYTILNIRTDEPTLRYDEDSLEAQKFRKNFGEELAELKQSKKVNSFLIAHSQLILSSPRWKVTPKEAFDLVKNYISINS